MLIFGGESVITLAHSEVLVLLLSRPTARGCHRALLKLKQEGGDITYIKGKQASSVPFKLSVMSPLRGPGEPRLARNTNKAVGQGGWSHWSLSLWLWEVLVLTQNPNMWTPFWEKVQKGDLIS